MDSDAKHVMFVMMAKMADGGDFGRALAGDMNMFDFVPVALDPFGNVLTTHFQATWGAAFAVEAWTDVMLLDNAGTPLFDRRIEGGAVITALAFSSTGEAFLGGGGQRSIVYGSKALPEDPTHPLFLMKLEH